MSQKFYYDRVGIRLNLPKVSKGKGSKKAADAKKSHRYDAGNEFFHVDSTPLTKAQVAPYAGDEFSDWKERGLKPDKIYRIYRPPEELSKKETINSLIGIPVMLEHEWVDPKEKPKQLVGSLGDSPVWKAPYLMNSMHITSEDAWKRIEDGSMKELSLGYTRDIIWKPGVTPEGEKYDGKMVNIRANHLAIVAEGRAGPDVCVLDDAKALKRHLTKRVNTAMDENFQQNLTAAIMQAITNAFAASTSAAASPETATGLDEGDEAQSPAPEASAEESTDDGEEVGTSTDEDEGKTSADDDAEVAQEAQAQDEDGNSEDEDDESCDEDESSEDEDEESCDELSDEDLALLEASGLSDASDEVKIGFFKGIAAANKRSAQNATDTAKNLQRKTKAAKTAKAKARVSDSKHNVVIKSTAKRKGVAKDQKSGLYVGRSLEARKQAAKHVRATTGALLPQCFDSAASIYKHALSQLGVKVPEKDVLLSGLKRTYDNYVLNNRPGKFGSAQRAADAASGTKSSSGSSSSSSKLSQLLNAKIGV